jgi:3-deoxy-D-manno-octulosonic acid kinase
MADPLHAQTIKIGAQEWVRFDLGLFEAEPVPSPEELQSWFDPKNLRSEASPVGAGGRSAAWFLRVRQLYAVLRHYRRGGWAAKLLRTRYVWTGLTKTRSFAEFELLGKMHRAGLPVPQPIAAHVYQRGVLYEAALLTVRIPDAQPLARIVDAQVWAQAGREIARMHAFGVWHADLNVYNIMSGQNDSIWLIDFDRSRAGGVNEGLRAENLSRLLRSIRKVVPEQERSGWPALNRAYQHAWLGFTEHME